MGLFRIVAYGIEIMALLVMVGLSLTAAIVIGLLKGDYDGNCPLYATVTEYGPADYLTLRDVSNCNFVIGMHSVAIFIAIFAGVYKVMELIKQKKLISSAYIPMFFVVLYLLIALLILVTACIITVGFNKFCKELESRDQPDYVRCIHYQLPNIMPPYDASHFYDYLVTAETTAWLSFGFWLCLSGLTVFLNVCCNNRM